MISFQDIQVKFDDFIAIQNLNLDIKEGEFFTFLGPSGCGKTTTLRTLVGFITPTKGKIFVDGEDLTNTPIEKRQIGMVFQSYALFPTMSVYENIAFGLKVQKYKKEEIKKRVDEIAKVVDLKEDKLMKNVSELSGGQQQRVAIARALALAPKIIVLDEPLSNLDAKLRKQLRKELKKLQLEQGITTVYVTHDQEEALTLSDRVAVFNNGVVEQVGTPEEIYNQSKTEFVCNFIGEANSISEEVIDEISKRSGIKFDSAKKYYIRTEKIKTKILDSDNQSVELHAKVDSKEFYGTYSQYKYEVMGTSLINIEKEDGNFQYSEGDEVTLFINPKDILQY
ncbi:ABC transporter ATP-binding protein [Metabacillus sediminilitoris]|uniref:ABC transporter ATP-binding protein n=1 Tax=Metabacillus sediminilitoris TaxID=2567941 RepID=A0A4S4BPJ6_9BACI|nr:ABC transporter ATP-binding protein [Metabacillus sediminilitoris]QGQ48407.1 ATP-binding cassette domain-containing protein [Metabacillus sediminilitoris]THF76304.1 ABC transporter ATP-binding protein [Metabacillus sediminilitoris]